jgi:uncharacterized protein (TIGR00369 family)
MTAQGRVPMRAAAMTVEELTRRLTAEFPQAFNDRSGLSILEVWHGGARVRQDFRDGALRPGGTVSGPVLMALTDVSIYIAILSAIGWVPLAVTTNLSINFLKKPAPGPLIAEAKLLKLGKRLAVGEIAIRSEGEDDLVAHATATYSIPPRA